MESRSTPLLQKNNPPNKDEGNKVALEVLKKTSLFGIRSLFVAFHYVGNGLIMSSLGRDAAAASSVASTIQSFTIGLTSGYLVNSGHELGKVLGELKYDPNKVYTKEQLSEVSRTTRLALNLTISLGALSTAAFVSTRAILPLFLEKPVAKAASDYLSAFAGAAIPDLLVWTQGQFIFQINQNALLPLLVTMSYRAFSVAMSYYFCHQLGFGPAGVGYGATIAGWASVLLLQPWFFRKIYRDIGFYNPYIKNYFSEVLRFSKTGWKHSLQRITEWGNLAIITQIIGAWGTLGLLAEQPSVLTLTLCNILSQGFAQASLMMASTDCAAQKKSLQTYYITGNPDDLSQVEKYKKRVAKNIYVSSVGSIVLNTILSTILYIYREKIVNFYVPSQEHDIVDTLSIQLLLINIFSLLPDAIRMIAGGVLRGWGDLLAPTLMSLLLMSVLGIPVGYGIGEAFHRSIIPFFAVRLGALVLAAAYNCARYYSHASADENAYQFAQLHQEIHTRLDGYNVRIFEIFARMTDDQSVESVKRILARHLQCNLAHYSSWYQQTSNLAQVTDDILYALSRALRCSLVVTDGSSTPLVIKQNTTKRVMYLRREDNINLILLDGKPEASLVAALDQQVRDPFIETDEKEALSSEPFKQFKEHKKQQAQAGSSNILMASFSAKHNKGANWWRLPFMRERAPESMPINDNGHSIQYGAV